MRSSLTAAADLLRHSAYTLALTGAGISTPSGIPDFRSPNAGLWTLVDPLQVASIWAFHENPDAFYHWIRPVLQKIQAARPNEAHQVLAQMERAQLLRGIVTQNIDSLHQRAGSQSVHEIHGHARTATCLSCREACPAAPLLQQVIDGGPAPRCQSCGGLLKPDVVLFGEPLPYESLLAAQQDALHCEVLLVAGTSLEVMPAADLPLLAKRRGARLIFINLAPTVLDQHADIAIHADVVDAMRGLWRLLNRKPAR